MSKTLAAAIAQAKCPKCRQGNMFPVSPFSYRKLSVIHSRCAVCDASLTPEPGFYDGAMYISYAFSVALMFTSLVAINVLVEEPKLWMYLTLVVVLTIFLMPAMLRYSKTLYQYGVGKLRYRGF
jgi:uncharacterized protein (DUF983 family)